MLFAILLLYTTGLVSCSSNCSNSIFTPVDWPGAALSVSDEQLSKSLTCFGNLTAATPYDAGPILLVPGTGVERAALPYNIAWTIELNRLNWPYCLVDPPDHGLGDIQRSGEYIVYAVRTMYQRANRHRINIMGHSQGGMSPRWALRFWPDIRSMVNNMIGFAPANHGIENTQNISCTQGCLPAFWQFLIGSQFMCALNSFQETFDNQIAYTQIITRYDQTIRPINGSELSGGANIYVQDICDNNTVDHVGIGVYDQIAFLIVMDALSHNGSASVTRIRQGSCPNASCCNRLYMANLTQTLINYISQQLNSSNSSQLFAANYPTVTEEPKLKCYVTRDCAMKSGSPITLVTMKLQYFILFVALIVVEKIIIF